MGAQRKRVGKKVGEKVTERWGLQVADDAERGGREVPPEVELVCGLGDGPHGGGEVLLQARDKVLGEMDDGGLGVGVQGGEGGKGEGGDLLVVVVEADLLGKDVLHGPQDGDPLEPGVGQGPLKGQGVPPPLAREGEDIDGHAGGVIPHKDLGAPVLLGEVHQQPQPEVGKEVLLGCGGPDPGKELLEGGLVLLCVCSPGLGSERDPDI